MSQQIDEFSRREKITLMHQLYEELITQKVTDLTRWQEVHRILPAEAAACLQFAMLCCGWNDVTRWMMAITESPAMLATGLGCTDYDEGRKTAVFPTEQASRTFRARFPLWRVCPGFNQEEK